MIFDSGLQQKNVRLCVRTRDPELIAELRANEGRGYFDPENTASPMIFRKHPHRVSLTAAGRIEVYQKIGGPDTGWKSPDGPHTHLLPKLLAAGRTHSANTTIPEGCLPVASLHPASPFSIPDGTERPFCKATWLHYAKLMVSHCALDAAALRAGLAAGARQDSAEPIIDAGELPEGVAPPQGRHPRHAARVWKLEQKLGRA